MLLPDTARAIITKCGCHTHGAPAPLCHSRFLPEARTTFHSVTHCSLRHFHRGRRFPTPRRACNEDIRQRHTSSSGSGRKRRAVVICREGCHDCCQPLLSFCLKCLGGGEWRWSRAEKTPGLHQRTQPSPNHKHRVTKETQANPGT